MKNLLRAPRTWRLTDIYFILFISAIVIGILVSLQLTEPRLVPDLEYLPIYPGASELQDQPGSQQLWEIRDGIGTKSVGALIGPHRTVTFKTRDNVDEVIAYYKETMGEAGWSLAEVQNVPGQILHFNYEEMLQKACLFRRNCPRNVHYVTIYAERVANSDGEMLVRLEKSVIGLP
jgi:hypothetical protein